MAMMSQEIGNEGNWCHYPLRRCVHPIRLSSHSIQQSLTPRHPVPLQNRPKQVSLIANARRSEEIQEQGWLDASLVPHLMKMTVERSRKAEQ